MFIMLRIDFLGNRNISLFLLNDTIINFFLSIISIFELVNKVSTAINVFYLGYSS